MFSILRENLSSALTFAFLREISNEKMWKDQGV